MIPYGAENSDAKTFPVPDHEQVLGHPCCRGYACLSFFPDPVSHIELSPSTLPTIISRITGEITLIGTFTPTAFNFETGEKRCVPTDSTGKTTRMLL